MVDIDEVRRQHRGMQSVVARDVLALCDKVEQMQERVRVAGKMIIEQGKDMAKENDLLRKENADLKGRLAAYR